MVLTAESEETEDAAGSQHKHKRPKSEKTRAQKDKHNLYCVKSRLKQKRRREELEKVENNYRAIVPEYTQMQAENKKMKMELEQNKCTIQLMENSIQELRRTLQMQGQNFRSVNESVESFLSQSNMQDGQVSATSGTVLVRLGVTATNNFLPSVADHCQQMGFDIVDDYINQPDFNMFAGLDCTNITAPAAGPFSVANHDLPFVFGAPDSHVNEAGFGAWINSAADTSFGANHENLPGFYAPNNHGNLDNNDLAAGVVTGSAGGSSSGANPELPIVFNATNNQENDVDRFADAPFTGFQPCENPRQTQFGDGFLP